MPTLSVREIGKFSFKCFNKAISAKYFGENACLVVESDSRAKFLTFISNLIFLGPAPRQRQLAVRGVC